MENTGGITPVMPVGSDGFGNNSWFWIIILLFFFWGGNNGFNNNNDIARESTMLNQFNERDLFSINQNVSQSRYDAAIGNANLDKDILLGNSAIQNLINTTALNQSASQAACCCELKTAIHAEGEETRALITQNRIADLTNQLQLAEIASANAVQTQNILNSLGNYYPKTGVNPYSVYSTCGCQGSVL